MKVVDLLEGKKKVFDKEWDEVPEKDLSNDQRWDLLVKRKKGLEHQEQIIRDRELYVLDQARAKGWIFNDEDKPWYSIPADEAKAKNLLRLPTMNWAKTWYYSTNSPHIDKIVQLKDWLTKLRQKQTEINDTISKISRRLKGLRSASKRMGLPSKYTY